MSLPSTPLRRAVEDQFDVALPDSPRTTHARTSLPEDASESNTQVATPPQSPRSASPHPLEAHVLQLEQYEVERPPFYNQSTIAPNLIFSADSLRQDARILAKILVSFMAYALTTHGTTNSCEIGNFGRFEPWPGRPSEAKQMAATVLNEKNIVYLKALKYTRRDLEDRGLYLRKFSIRDGKKLKVIIADWIVDMTPVTQNSQYPHHTNNHLLSNGLIEGHQSRRSSVASYPLPTANELIRMHQAAHSSNGQYSRPQSRMQSMTLTEERDFPSPPRSRPQRSSPAHIRKTRNANDLNEFGYYGNKCNIM